MTSAEIQIQNSVVKELKTILTMEMKQKVEKGIIECLCNKKLQGILWKSRLMEKIEIKIKKCFEKSGKSLPDSNLSQLIFYVLTVFAPPRYQDSWNNFDDEGDEDVRASKTSIISKYLIKFFLIFTV